jgi:hypothetical protein
MTHVPLLVRCAFAVVLVGTMMLAFWGRPPRRRPRPTVWRKLAVGGAVCYGAGCGALLLDQAVISAALVGVGVETLSVVAWLGRGLGGEDEEGGGGGGTDGDDPDRSDRGGDGDGPDDSWHAGDDRAFWDHVERGRRTREPIAG